MGRTAPTGRSWTIDPVEAAGTDRGQKMTLESERCRKDEAQEAINDYTIVGRCCCCSSGKELYKRWQASSRETFSTKSGHFRPVPGIETRRNGSITHPRDYFRILEDRRAPVKAGALSVSNGSEEEAIGFLLSACHRLTPIRA